MKKVTNSEKIFNFIIHVLSYSLVIYIVDLLFDSVYSENIFYIILVSLIISILEKTIKPIIFKYTIFITAITFGLFYPFINYFILKIVDFLLRTRFDISGFFYGLLVAVLISMMQFLLEHIIIKSLIEKGEKNE